ncbi:MAG: hypothetical protein RLZZ129_1540 [Verrucomicrobiota bacterium]|jgi:hypothetical protein
MPEHYLSLAYDLMRKAGWRALFALLAGLTVQAEQSAVAAPTVLSNAGCGRATAYWEQNKIITVGEKTHVVWLDSDASGFHVRGRTLDRTTGVWSPTVTIGEAQDNHGGPGLTVDSQGYLHVLYYPHHEQFRYRRSTRPNDLSEWGSEIRVGEGLSFPSLICLADDTLLLSARRGYHDADGKPIESRQVEQEFWRKPAGGEWERVTALIRSRYSGYAQFAAALIPSPDGKTVHLNCRIYEGNPFIGGYQAYTVGYMRSTDGGVTWTKADGTPLTLPVTADTIEVLAKDIGLAGPQVHSGPLAVDAAGVPHHAYTARFGKDTRLYLATPAPGLGWTRRDLTPDLPAAVQGWVVTMTMGGGMSFSDSGRATIIAVVLNPSAEEYDTLKEWGHPTTEVVRLWSDDGLKTFQSEILSPLNTGQTHWLPNIERHTGHNRVPDAPGIIYTAGGAGEHLKDLELNNEVRWQPQR